MRTYVTNNPQIQKFDDLVTSREETRAGFIQFALEKNRCSTPYIEEAKTFKIYASKAKSPDDLLDIAEIRKPLLTASGLSDKALNYFTEEDKTNAILGLIDKFLKPAGEHFIDEVVYRYLLIRGDSLGGSMRNIVGFLAQQKFIRTFISCLNIRNLPYVWLDGNNKGGWKQKPRDDYQIENSLKAISWEFNGKSTLLGFNLKIPTVHNNVDLCLFSAKPEEFPDILSLPQRALLFGELKGGIDPAGADEHWKTGNTALERIRSAFNRINTPIQTIFVGAAIEVKMAQEIFLQLTEGKLTNVANLTKDSQLVELCDWIITNEN